MAASVVISQLIISIFQFAAVQNSAMKSESIQYYLYSHFLFPVAWWCYPFQPPVVAGEALGIVG
jgi:hypothetical protein